MTRRARFVAVGLVVALVAVAGVALGQASEADLVVSEVGAEAPVAGAEGNVTAVVENRGPDPVAGFSVAFYWESEGAFLTGEEASSTQDRSATVLAAGEEETVELAWTPSEDQAGSGRVIAVVDAGSAEDPDGGNDAGQVDVFVVLPDVTADASWGSDPIEVDVGSTRDFAFTVRNQGNVHGTYVPSVTEPSEPTFEAWAFSVTPPSAEVLPGRSATFALTVSVPETAEAGVTVGSEEGLALNVSQEGYEDSELGVASPAPPSLVTSEARGLSLNVSQLDAARPGEQIPAGVVTVNNTGNTNETVDLERAPDQGTVPEDWDVSLDPETVELDAFEETQEPRLEVTVPSDALAGDYEIVTLAVAREGSLPPVAQHASTVTVEHVHGVNATLEDASGAALPDEPARVDVTVENTGNGNDTVTLDANAPDGWTVASDPPQLELAPGGQATLTVEATPPPQAPPQEDVPLEVTLSTTGDDAAATATVTPTVTVLEGPNLRLDAPDDAVPVHPAQGTTVPLPVANQGNQHGSLAVTATEPEGWSASLDRRSVDELPPGDERSLYLTVTGPEGALTGQAASVVLDLDGDTAMSESPEVPFVVGGPDWSVTLTHAPGSVLAGDQAPLNVTVESQGMETTPETSLEVDVDGNQGLSAVDTFTVPSLEPGDEVAFNTTWDTTGWQDTVIVRATANPDDAFDEEDDASSQATRDVFVQAPALRVEAPPPRTVDPGQRLHLGPGPLGLSVVNEGNVDADIVLDATDEEGWIQTSHQATLAPGEEHAFPLEFSVPRPTGAVENNVTLEASLPSLTDETWTDAWRVQVRDVAPPRVLDVNATGPLAWGEQATLRVDWDDGTGIQEGTVTIDPPSEAPTELPLDVDEGNVSFGWQPSAAGEHELTVSLADLAGNQASSGTLTLDVDPPEPPRVLALDKDRVAPGVPLPLNLTSVAPIERVEAKVPTQGVDERVSAPYRLNTTGWAQGEHELHLVVVDEAGQRASAVQNVTVDASPPTLTSARLDPASPEPGDRVTASLSFDQPVEEVVVVLVGEEGQRAAHKATVDEAREVSVDFRVTDPVERVDVEATNVAGAVLFEEDAVAVGSALLGVPGVGVLAHGLVVGLAGAAWRRAGRGG